MISGFDAIIIEFSEYNKNFSKKIASLNEINNESEENYIKIIQWNNFDNFLNNEVSTLKDEYVNRIISKEIYLMSEEENTDKIDIKKLADKLKLKCKVVIPRIKELIDVSKLQGDLLEDKKELIVHTDAYHKNRELKNYTENRILKQTQDKVGQLLALYDSCIKNKTLGVNFLEIQNRINDMSNFKKFINDQYNLKVKELNVDEKRLENRELSNNIIAIVKNNELAIEKINENLLLFKDLESFMVNEFNALKIEIENIFAKAAEVIEKVELYGKMKEILDGKIVKVDEKIKQTDDKIEEKLKNVITKTFESKKFEPEAREFYLEKKNEIKKQVTERVEQIEETINSLKLETNRNKLLSMINKNKIHLSQLLGTLQTRVEDYIETEQYRRAYIRVIKKNKYIEQEIRNTNKRIKDLYKEFIRNSNNFDTKNQHIINEFDRFIKEFNEILREKVKALEELIIKSYVDMAVKAVANEFLTLSFLQNELKIKKPLIQKHLISLISAGKLSGKFDPQIGLYYENPEVLKSLNENELEVIKKMNFRVYMFMRRLKNLANQYGSIIAFFASIITISYYIFRISGENPMTIFIPIVLTLIVLGYLLFKKKKDEKI